MTWKDILAIALLPFTILSALFMVQEYNKSRPIGMRCMTACSNRRDIVWADALVKCVEWCSSNTNICN